MSTAHSPIRPTAPDPGRELVLAVMATHAGALLALARRHSLCADDAHDAYQRALEIFLRRADSLEPAGAPAWLRTVVKHEAMAVRAARARIVGPVEFDADRAEARELLPADERVAASERTARSAEALARLKPQEVRALVLKARGYSYNEIAEITGWTYTKVNRCLTEGRRAFLDRFADIEAGRECERWAGTLSALADGEASAQELAAARPHLRHCPSCRARLREFRAVPRAVAAIAPDAAALAAAAGGGPGVLARMHDAVVSGWQERVLLSAHKLQAGVEAVSAGKLAVVAASATALAGGGAAALTEVADRPPARPAAATVAPVSSAEPGGGASGGRDSIAPTEASTAPPPAPAGAPPAAQESRPQPSRPPAAAEFDVGAAATAPPDASPSSPGTRPTGPVRPSRVRPASSSPSRSTAFEFGP